LTSGSLSRLPRNVLILALCQALGLAGAPFVILVGGLLGAEFAPLPGLATAPIAALVVGTALGAVPAARLMRRIGRRAGFIAGTFVGLLAALTGIRAVSAGSFTILCLATGLVGMSTAFVQQYRFAAIESVGPERAGTAVSIVLLGGVAAGFIGPQVAQALRDWIGPRYTGSFLGLGILYIAVALLLGFLAEPPDDNPGSRQGGLRSVRELLRQRDFLVAIAASTVGFGTMSFIMTATPVSMHTFDGHSVEATSRVIQSHAVAMYLPSLFSGAIIAALGARRTMLAGIGAFAATMVAASSGHSFRAYWLALVLLGVGWNFLFVGGTVLLSTAYRPVERFRAQAVNDFLVFTIQALAALSAGVILHAVGWPALVLVPIPVLALMIGLLTLTRSPHARTAPIL
jgi:predicted MFS family arabinose efflux permease